MKNIFVLIILSLIIFSCKDEKSPPDESIINRNYKEEFDKYFQSNYKTIISNAIVDVKIDSIDWVNTFYNDIDFEPIWINDSIQLTNQGIALVDQLKNAQNFGLQTRFYDVNALIEGIRDLNKNVLDKRYKAASQLEVLLTYFYMLHGKHLNYGLLQVTDSITSLPRKKFNIDLPDYLQKAYEKDSLMEKLLQLQPKQKEYHNLQKALTTFLEKTDLSTKNIDVINFREDSLKATKLAKEALVLLNYIDEKSKDSLYFSALTKFQIEHGLKPDSLIGKNTAKALSISPYKYYLKIVAGLERWRWKNTNWPADYIYANIPAFRLQLVKNDTIVKRHNVVVGTLKNQTPELIDTLEYIIAYPYWNVPRKISLEEIVVKARKDSTYLKRNNYEVLTYSKEKVDPSEIDWATIDKNNFKYLIRQEGGSYNSLGLVKFIFPNKYSIYLHDTPSKYYFNMESRAYSHGCVRVQHALELADYILKEDNNKYNLDSIYNYIDRKKEKPMSLNTKIPIYIYYMPVVADSDGNIIFYNDIYGLDDKLINQLIAASN